MGKRNRQKIVTTPSAVVTSSPEAETTVIETAEIIVTNTPEIEVIPEDVQEEVPVSVEPVRSERPVLQDGEVRGPFQVHSGPTIIRKGTSLIQ